MSYTTNMTYVKIQKENNLKTQEKHIKVEMVH